MSHHHPRPSFPTPSARHAPPPTTPSGGGRPLNPAQKIPPGASGSGIGGRKIRPLIYAIGVAGIVCSGALIGAILKTSREHQQEAPQKTQVEQLPQESPRQQQADAVKPDYAKYIQTLETKRGHLLGQKIQLERKIQDLHESQRRRAEEEAIKKELGMKK